MERKSIHMNHWNYYYYQLGRFIDPLIKFPPIAVIIAIMLSAGVKAVSGYTLLERRQ